MVIAPETSMEGAVVLGERIRTTVPEAIWILTPKPPAPPKPDAWIRWSC